MTEKLKEIHSIKSKKFNFFMNLENKYFSNYFEVLENKLKIVKDKAFKNTFVNTERLKYLLDIFNKNKECFNLEQGVLIHNDLWYKNILSNENKLT
ncbi:MAG: hypothetical protein LBD88_04490 [Candidatus Peribacteria bacterium]|nr:hypothetical protein [Candidatus Peribacteria bacterium]